MGFAQAISTVFKKYADFTGVARRSEYWWWVLFSTVISLILTGIDTAISGGNGMGIGVLAGLWSLATLLPSLAVGVRRLRDAGYAWGFMFLALIPIVGAIVLIVMLCQPSKATTSVPQTQPAT